MLQVIGSRSRSSLPDSNLFPLLQTSEQLRKLRRPSFSSKTFALDRRRDACRMHDASEIPALDEAVGVSAMPNVAGVERVYGGERHDQPLALPVHQDRRERGAGARHASDAL